MTQYYTLVQHSNGEETQWIPQPDWDTAMAKAVALHEEGVYYSSVADNRGNWWKEFFN